MNIQELTQVLQLHQEYYITIFNLFLIFCLREPLFQVSGLGGGIFGVSSLSSDLGFLIYNLGSFNPSPNLNVTAPNPPFELKLITNTFRDTSKIP